MFLVPPLSPQGEGRDVCFPVCRRADEQIKKKKK
nr:MAG TPA: hypothetical protein [Caudoviricetes sp.]